MALIPRLLIVIGSLSLIHACYSAHEHSTLHKSPSASSSSSSSSFSPAASLSPSSTTTSLPTDIAVETILSVLAICVGLVMGAPALKPISWRVWAAEIEDKCASGEGTHPFIGLESRIGFLDIRAKRKEFAEWVKEQGSSPVPAKSL